MRPLTPRRHYCHIKNFHVPVKDFALPKPQWFSFLPLLPCRHLYTLPEMLCYVQKIKPEHFKVIDSVRIT